MLGVCISMKAKGALRWQHSFWGSTRPEHYYSRWIVRYVEAPTGVCTGGKQISVAGTRPSGTPPRSGALSSFDVVASSEP